MIHLVQHKSPKANLCANYMKVDEIAVKFNKELIDKDIDRLSKLMTEATNKRNILNYKTLIAYLKKLSRKIGANGTFDMCWNTSVKDGLPYTYPLKFINESLYAVDTCNYIELGTDEKLVEIINRDMADLIAFELMYQDVGETHDSIENILSSCGIIGVEDSSILDKYKDGMFELSKSLKIDESPYKYYETHKISDYFHTKEFDCTRYKDVVSYSCKYANTIVGNNIIDNCEKNGLVCEMLTLSPTTVAFKLHRQEDKDGDTNGYIDNLDIETKILDDIVVRAFGRRFKTRPQITIL